MVMHGKNWREKKRLENHTTGHASHLNPNKNNKTVCIFIQTVALQHKTTDIKISKYRR